MHKRRMLIVDVLPESVNPAINMPVGPKAPAHLHLETQQTLLSAMSRYGYELGKSEPFEAAIWKRVDKILKARSQEEAERLAADAEEFGLLNISVWRKKVS